MKQYEVTVNFPSEYEPEISQEIERVAFLLSKQVQIIRKSRNGKVYNSANSLIYVAVIYAIAKPFMESFLKELGSGTAKALAEAFAQLTLYIKAKKHKIVTSHELERLIKKVEKQNRDLVESDYDRLGKPTPPLAFQVYILDNLPVNFIFPNAVTPKRMSTVLRKIPLIIQSHLSLLQKQNYSKFIEYAGKIEYVLHGYEWVMPEFQELIYNELVLNKARNNKIARPRKQRQKKSVKK